MEDSEKSVTGGEAGRGNRTYELAAYTPRLHRTTPTPSGLRDIAMLDQQMGVRCKDERLTSPSSKVLERSYAQ